MLSQTILPFGAGEAFCPSGRRSPWTRPREYFTAQSSLSEALRLCENDLGTPIFLRTTRGVRPTPAGAAYIENARRILNQYRRARSEAWDIEGLKGGQVEFGISSYRGMHISPPVLSRFRALYPKVHVQITELDSIDLEDLILKGLLDIALIAMPPVRLKENVEFLISDEILIIATADHPVMEYVHPVEDGTDGWVRFADTMRFEYILGPPSTVLGRAARRGFRLNGAEPIGLNTGISAPLAARMAMEGLGLALTYRSCVVPGERVRYLRIGPRGIFLDLGLAYPAGEYRSKATIALGEVFHELYQANPTGTERKWDQAKIMEGEKER